MTRSRYTQKGKIKSVILVRGETTPEDIHGMEIASGILTSRGGMTSHAAVVTRGMGKCCVAGAGDIVVDEKKREMRVKGQTFKEGDWLSLDGTTGRVIKGKLNTIPASADNPDLVKFMSWADPYRKLGVRANADIPRDAKQARQFGAEGIGLCRTEHMFFAEDRLPFMRAMILADNEKDRRAALKKLLPMQRADFVGLFKAMDGLPVIDPHARSSAARVPAQARGTDGGNRQARDHQAEVSQAEGASRAVVARGRAARDQPDARTTRLPLGNHLSGDHRDAGARHSGGGRRRQEKGHQGASGDHDPAHQRHQGDEEPGRHLPPRRRRGLQGEGHDGRVPGGNHDRAAACLL